MTREADWESAVAETVRQLGGLDIVVNNAGIALYAPVAEVSVEDIDRQLAVNVRSPILASQAAIPHLGAGGRIILIGSGVADRIVGEAGRSMSSFIGADEAKIAMWQGQVNAVRTALAVLPSATSVLMSATRRLREAQART